MQGRTPGGHIWMDRFSHGSGSSVLDEKSVKSMTRSKKSVILSKICLSAVPWADTGSLTENT